MKRPESEKQVVETRFGPADYHITPEGQLKLSWRGPVTINGVEYHAPWISPHHSYPEIHLQPKDYRRAATPAARAALEKEHQKLSDQLIHPASIQEARIRRQEWQTWNAWSDMQQAEQALTEARAKFEEEERRLRELAPARAQALCGKTAIEMSLEELLSV
ncbi:hypothetical protein Deipr_2366 (plasmid) [Deinococcus proteolyticus MRP]|uniref:Uncharacterized protein n=1 Tax=Deinococcus proteolyticus (strain ATCC 35074 / DSM 20540 / JCM 6276 / NBRC 101906 / NCIMB 13154 / VKM Ac-1939 / CCM 2703 / MRP) TaxID=693977 RepID=F0RQD1_DEIPM|nr:MULTISPECIES: hypothetical protein [Deinococcus]ADY27490.1 hypothetical protein Deipr_2366 [Deinococcus proteolyticus MRP]MCY1704007.1 hypothetical protein [Deinococcus sp. SL84]